MDFLNLKKGTEYKVRIEDAEEFKTSFFADIYLSAFKSIKEIVDNTDEYHSARNENSPVKNKIDNGEYNNIIAFTGDRGTGKSSTMLTIAKALSNSSRELKNFNSELGWVKEYNFNVLDIIDPSLFESSDSIIEVIIAKMFKEFNSIINNKLYKQAYNPMQYKDLLNSFQMVYQNLKVINSDKNELFVRNSNIENLLENLSLLAQGSNMRESFIELIKNYLIFINDDSQMFETNSFIVVPIDDLDMNIANASIMIEQIRKYLLIPNVIILMAIKIEQLSDSIEQEYRKTFSVLLKKPNKISDFNDFPKYMAARYIEKIIPDGRKLYLPEIKSADIAETKIIRFYKERPDEDEDLLSIEQKVLKMTYEKTGIPFIKSAYGTHYLVPDNLRELHNYLMMFDKMPDIRDEKGVLNIKANKGNLDSFEQYFLNSWCKSNLSIDEIDFIIEIINTDLRLKNKYVLTTINNYINKSKNRILNNSHVYNLINKDKVNKTTIDSEVADVCTREIIMGKDTFDNKRDFINSLSLKSNSPLNYSLGDVLSILQIFEEFDDSESTRKLTFAVRTIYSIFIYKLIFLSEAEKNEIKEEIIDIISNNKNDYNKKHNEIIAERNYEALCNILGGNVFGYSARKFMRKERYSFTINKYEKLETNGKNLNTLILEICRIDNPTIVDIEEYTKNVRLIEWLHYFLLIGSERKAYERNKLHYNVKNDFSTNIGKTTTAKFSIDMFIFFLLNPKKNIERIFENNINSGMDKETILKNIEKVSFINEINDWKNYNGMPYPMVLPIYSMDIMDYVVNYSKDSLFFDYKEGSSTDNFYIYFEYFIKSLKEAISNISTKNPFLGKVKPGLPNFFEQIFNTCPIINKSIITRNDVRELLNSIWIFSEASKGNLSDFRYLKKNEDFSFGNKQKSQSIINQIIQLRDNLKEEASLETKKKLNEIIEEMYKKSDREVVGNKTQYSERIRDVIRTGIRYLDKGEDD